MKRVFGMLLIGSDGRNAGKTELACNILRAVGGETRIVALKVSMRHGSTESGQAFRAEEDRSRYPSEQGRIIEEFDTRYGKDTSRLLAAGAFRVLRLVSTDSLLTQDLDRLLRLVPPNHPMICESNSARMALEPDLFIMVRSRSDTEMKPSAIAVREFVDHIVRFDGSRHDLDLSRLTLRDGRWHLRTH